MHLERRCVSCPAFPNCPQCNTGEECSIIAATCDTCAQAVCKARISPSQKSGPNSGAIAGGVVGAFVLIAIVAAVIWYRRRKAFSALLARKRATPEIKPQPDVIARPDAVLSRPDPIEKPLSSPPPYTPPAPPPVRTYSAEAINLDPQYPTRQPAETNPFSDEASIITASDKATNVIPIAYVPPSSASQISDTSDFTSKTPASLAPSTMAPPRRPTSTQSAGAPRVPQRGPEIDMRLNLSRPASEAPSERSTLAPPKAPYAPSAVSGVSSRASTISTTSSFLNEAPQIVTPLQAGFRQVLGVHKAEVVQLNVPSSNPSTARSSRATQGTSMRSPLAQNAFTADDMVHEDSEDGHSIRDPFSDGFSTVASSEVHSPNSDLTFGGNASRVTSMASTPNGWEDESRPTSMVSHVGTIVADISNATRVQVARPVARSNSQRSTTDTVTGSAPSTAPSTPRQIDFRNVDQLSPPAQGVPRSFDDMMGNNARMSQSSFATTHRTSTADSILESFPFVPPSPISMHHSSQPGTPLSPRGFSQQQQAPQQEPGRLAAPSRYTLGMSMMSSTSSGSNGLEAFSFQFGNQSNPSSPAPSATTQARGGERVSRASRASLDTLALSRDVEAFPLAYDSPATPLENNQFKK